MENYKIKVNNEAESKEVQDLFEQLGFTWAGDHPENGDWYSHLYAEKSSCCHLPIYVWNGLGDKFQELTLPQLRDLVVLHRNDVKDATHKYIGGGAAYKTVDDIAYLWTRMGWEYKGIAHDLVPIHKETEQGLISGADALRALADGDQVQWMTGDVFQDVNDEWQIREFSHPSFKFRLKPRTIKLELEIPAPFEPKVGDIYYYINSSNLKGYGFTKFANDGDDECLTFYGAWRSESEIKKVVAALRRGIKA